MLGSTDTAGKLRVAIQRPVQRVLRELLGLEGAAAAWLNKMVAVAPHVFFFAVLGWLAVRSGKEGLVWAALAIAAAAEGLQLLTGSRSATVGDLAVNLVSVGVGGSAAWVLRHRGDTEGTE